MKIIVLSYHKGEDTYVPFYGLMEKYYPNHPEIIYFTDGNINPFYKTIPVETEIDKWLPKTKVIVGVNCKWEEGEFWEWWKSLTLDCDNSYTVIYKCKFTKIMDSYM